MFRVWLRIVSLEHLSDVIGAEEDNIHRYDAAPGSEARRSVVASGARGRVKLYWCLYSKLICLTLRRAEACDGAIIGDRTQRDFLL